MTTENVEQRGLTSAQSWPHEGLLSIIRTPAVIFNRDAGATELIAWAHGQSQIAVQILAALIPQPDEETTEGNALSAVHALLEPVQSALELAIVELRGRSRA